MNTFTTYLLAAGLVTLGSRAASAQVLYDNFEDTRIVGYPIVNGTLNQSVANPGSNAVNSSPTCASYVRSTGQYDAFVVKPSAANTRMADVSAYAAGTKKISVKFRGPAAGLSVQAVLQNSAKNPSNYPNGKYAGDFMATTTKANEWETLTFTFAAASAGNFDPTVTPTEVDQLVLLVQPNTTVSNTTYLDDIMGPELVTVVPTAAVTDQLYDNYEGTRAVKYKGSIVTSGGFKLDTLNPASGPGNTSAHVLRYTRSNQQYDVLFLAPKGAPLADVTPFLSNAKQMTMKVYSPAAGTVFQITLQDSAKARANYPAGRHSEYQATTKSANAWETLTFMNTGRPDTNTPATGLNEIVLLIAPNTTKPGKFYIDDWTGPHLTNYVVTATRTSQTSAAALATAYPNPSPGLTHLPYSLQKPAVVSLALYDAMGRRVASVLDNQAKPAGDYTADLRTTSLAPGLYTCRLVVDGVALTRALSVE